MIFLHFCMRKNIKIKSCNEYKRQETHKEIDSIQSSAQSFGSGWVLTGSSSDQDFCKPDPRPTIFFKPDLDPTSFQKPDPDPDKKKSAWPLLITVDAGYLREDELKVTFQK